MNEPKAFSAILDIDRYVIDVVGQMHPNTDVSIFLGGSFARGKETSLSDIDYTVCVDDAIKHPRFYFELTILDKTPRLLSIYFYSYEEILIDKSKVDDEVYLWMKFFLPETRYVGGNKKVYATIRNFYTNLEYDRKFSAKTVHKSFGKLLELIARIKKWEDKGNFVEMVYYGTKLAEHVRRLVVEVNGPIAVGSENVYLQRHFDLPKLPRDFKGLYLEINRYSTNAIAPAEYRAFCVALVKNTAVFLTENKASVDDWTLSLLTNKIFTKYVDFGVVDNKKKG